MDIDNETKKKLLVILDNLDTGIEKKMYDFAYPTGISFTMEINRNI